MANRVLEDLHQHAIALLTVYNSPELTVYTTEQLGMPGGRFSITAVDKSIDVQFQVEGGNTPQEAIAEFEDELLAYELNKGDLDHYHYTAADVRRMRRTSSLSPEEAARYQVRGEAFLVEAPRKEVA